MFYKTHLQIFCYTTSHYINFIYIQGGTGDLLIKLRIMNKRDTNTKTKHTHIYNLFLELSNIKSLLLNNV